MAETLVKLPDYWFSHHLLEVQQAREIADLRRVALQILNRMPRPIVQVCGPLSTGGVGTLDGNLRRFERAIIVLKYRQFNVFDQMSFQPAMKRIADAAGGNGYYWPIIDHFYEPIFRSGLISETFFLPDWENSTGTARERQIVNECGIPVTAFLEEWLFGPP